METWYDADRDGEKDPDESPLPWVTIQMAYERSITDSSGHGTVGVFKPGCARRCWKGESVLVKVPPGYRATTPPEVDLTGPEATYRFGFRPEADVEAPVFPGEPDWARAFLYRGLDLVDFGYDADQKSLTLAFDTSGSADQDAFYGEVFEVMRTLKQVAGVPVEQVEITRLPSGQVAVCEMSQVEAWIGKLAPAEIVATYCQITEPSTSSATASRAEAAGAMHRPESPPVVGSFEGRWCFESKSAAFDMQLDQAGDGVSGPFFLLQYGELNVHATD